MSSDIKIRLIEANCYYYPDVVVTCHPDDLQGNEDFIIHPKVVIEVLSKSTAKFDGLRPTIGHRIQNLPIIRLVQNSKNTS